MPRSEPVNPARFFMIWLIASLAGIATVAGVDYLIDLYALFGNARGLSRVVHFKDREDKYLLTLNYVPANYPNVVIGSSVSLNWNLPPLPQGPTYNLSLPAGNATEERLLFDNVTAKRRLRTVVFVVYPVATESHGRLAGGMSPASVRQVFGSPLLFESYAEWAATRLGLKDNTKQPDGTERFPTPTELKALWMSDPAAVLAKVQFKPQDPEAFREYADLVRIAHERADQIVELRPPIPIPTWQLRGEAMLAYFAKVHALFRANDPLIDCNGPTFDAFRRDLSNYNDHVHISTERTRDFLILLNREMALRLLRPHP